MDFGCVRKEIAGAMDSAKRNPRDKLFAGDKTLDSEFEALGDVTHLARYHRDFHALLHRVILIPFLPALKGRALWIRRVHEQRGRYCWHEAPVEEVTAPKAAASEASPETSPAAPKTGGVRRTDPFTRGRKSARTSDPATAKAPH